MFSSLPAPAAALVAVLLAAGSAVQAHTPASAVPAVDEPTGPVRWESAQGVKITNGSSEHLVVRLTDPLSRPNDRVAWVGQAEPGAEPQIREFSRPAEETVTNPAEFPLLPGHSARILVDDPWKREAGPGFTVLTQARREAARFIPRHDGSGRVRLETVAEGKYWAVDGRHPGGTLFLRKLEGAAEVEGASPAQSSEVLTGTLENRSPARWKVECFQEAATFTRGSGIEVVPSYRRSIFSQTGTLSTHIEPGETLRVHLDERFLDPAPQGFLLVTPEPGDEVWPGCATLVAWVFPFAPGQAPARLQLVPYHAPGYGHLISDGSKEVAEAPVRTEGTLMTLHAPASRPDQDTLEPGAGRPGPKDGPRLEPKAPALPAPAVEGGARTWKQAKCKWIKNNSDRMLTFKLVECPADGDVRMGLAIGSGPLHGLFPPRPLALEGGPQAMAVTAFQLAPRDGAWILMDNPHNLPDVRPVFHIEAPGQGRVMEIAFLSSDHQADLTIEEIRSWPGWGGWWSDLGLSLFRGQKEVRLDPWFDRIDSAPPGGASSPAWREPSASRLAPPAGHGAPAKPAMPVQVVGAIGLKNASGRPWAVEKFVAGTTFQLDGQNLFHPKVTLAPGQILVASGAWNQDEAILQITRDDRQAGAVLAWTPRSHAESNGRARVVVYRNGAHIERNAAGCRLDPAAPVQCNGDRIILADPGPAPAAPVPQGPGEPAPAAPALESKAAAPAIPPVEGKPAPTLAALAPAPPVPQAAAPHPAAPQLTPAQVAQQKKNLKKRQAKQRKQEAAAARAEAQRKAGVAPAAGAGAKPEGQPQAKPKWLIQQEQLLEEARQQKQPGGGRKPDRETR